MADLLAMASSIVKAEMTSSEKETERQSYCEALIGEYQYKKVVTIFSMPDPSAPDAIRQYSFHERTPLQHHTDLTIRMDFSVSSADDPSLPCLHRSTRLNQIYPIIRISTKEMYAVHHVQNVYPRNTCLGVNASVRFVDCDIVSPHVNTRVCCLALT